MTLPELYFPICKMGIPANAEATTEAKWAYFEGEKETKQTTNFMQL